MAQQFRKYRKNTLTIARPLTLADYEQNHGTIQTLEGPKSFDVGAYLARDTKGVWPIRQTKVEQNYRRVSEPDSDGWASYQPLDIRSACQMSEPFVVGGLQGKAGDYLVQSEESQWPVDQEIFESSYILVDE